MYIPMETLVAILAAGLLGLVMLGYAINGYAITRTERRIEHEMREKRWLNIGDK